MGDKAVEKSLPLLNTTLSELPVHDLPIDCLTRDKAGQGTGGKTTPE